MPNLNKKTGCGCDPDHKGLYGSRLLCRKCNMGEILHIAKTYVDMMFEDSRKGGNTIEPKTNRDEKTHSPEL